MRRLMRALLWIMVGILLFNILFLSAFVSPPFVALGEFPKRQDQWVWEERLGVVVLALVPIGWFWVWVCRWHPRLRSALAGRVLSMLILFGIPLGCLTMSVGFGWRAWLDRVPDHRQYWQGQSIGMMVLACAICVGLLHVLAARLPRDP